MTQTITSPSPVTDRLIARFLETTGQRIHAYDSASAANKTLFHRRGKALLKQIAYDLGFTEGSYDLRSNKGGIAVSGEVTLHSDDLYVQFADSAFGSELQILYRRCQHRRDYTGGQNHFLPYRALSDYHRVIAALQSVRP